MTPKAAADCTETSVELGRRAAQRAERRMLIGGELIEAASGAEFDNLSPATGAVLGATAAAAGTGHGSGDRRGARQRSTTTDWSTNRTLRKRCLGAAAGRDRGRKGGAA